MLILETFSIYFFGGKKYKHILLRYKYVYGDL